MARGAAHIRLGFVSLFPEAIESAFAAGVVGRALKEGLIAAAYANPRDFTYDRHRTVDDRPYGGGAGMLMKPEPIALAAESLAMSSSAVVISPDPTGEIFCQETARELAGAAEILFLCGHYEGMDERVNQHFRARKISMGNFILTGGELPAAMIADAVSRLVPGVLGNEDSLASDSFSGAWDEGHSAPNYTRPPIWRGLEVPAVLRSGSHAAIEEWQSTTAKRGETEPTEEPDRRA